MGKLTIVPTPVGNLADMTFRAIAVLRDADLILAEDTRITARLLKKYGITTPMQSHHKFNEHKTVEAITGKLAAGMNVALVSDAGTPGISDPGYLLIRACLQAEVEIECLPGPTALIPALVVSGLPCDRFTFEGFLPQRKGRAARLRLMAETPHTVVFFESPFRLVATLRQLAELCGPDRNASVSRELSKIHEETIRGTLGELTEYFSNRQIRGEIVVVIQGTGKP
ncbi:MAG: 16S rRNA (cytidine(1402)-2'-O)-methyltransferase [Bacteroidales bacterium]|nr:16S rRNA (cytidine(1402)-2'-O)-methyltransferase [Bacteroidales bacterium]